MLERFYRRKLRPWLGITPCRFVKHSVVIVDDLAKQHGAVSFFYLQVVRRFLQSDRGV